MSHFSVQHRIACTNSFDYQQKPQVLQKFEKSAFAVSLPKAYLPDGEANLIKEGFLPGRGSFIALGLG